MKYCQGTNCANPLPPGRLKFCSNECARRKQNQRASTRTNAEKEPVEPSVLVTVLSFRCTIESDGLPYLTTEPIVDDEPDEVDAEIADLAFDIERFAHWAHAVGPRGPTD